jgi:hypothetical protein
MNHGEHALVEAMISIWNINQYGQIFKKQEVSFNYGKEFKPTTDGNMTLRLSGDSKIISLSLID